MERNPRLRHIKDTKLSLQERLKIRRELPEGDGYIFAPIAAGPFWVALAAGDGFYSTPRVTELICRHCKRAITLRSHAWGDAWVVASGSTQCSPLPGKRGHVGAHEPARGYSEWEVGVLDKKGKTPDFEIIEPYLTPELVAAFQEKDSCLAAYMPTAKVEELIELLTLRGPEIVENIPRVNPMAKWYVVDKQQICILDSGADFAEAQQKADALICARNLPKFSLKVMTKPAVGAVVLDPNDPSAWKPRRSANPARSVRRGQRTIEDWQGGERQPFREFAVVNFSAGPGWPRGEKLIQYFNTAEEAQAYADRQASFGDLRAVRVLPMTDEVAMQRRMRRNPEQPERGSLWMLRAPTSRARRDRVYEVIGLRGSGPSARVEYKDAFNGEIAECPLARWDEIMTQAPERNPDYRLEVRAGVRKVVVKGRRAFEAGLIVSSEGKQVWVQPGGRALYETQEEAEEAAEQMKDAFVASKEMVHNPAKRTAVFPPKIGSTWVIRTRGFKGKTVYTVTKSNERNVTFENVEDDYKETMATSDFLQVFTRAAQENPGELMIVNPATDTAKAEATYKMWHQRDPKEAKIVRPRVNDNDLMVCVGNAFSVVYASNKWEKDSRKTNSYIHHFDSRPKVWMLASCVPEGEARSNSSKTVGELLKNARNKDGQFACADLARPESFNIDDEETELKISAGARLLGTVDKKTIIILDPVHKIVVVKGGAMYFDERGIVK